MTILRTTLTAAAGVLVLLGVAGIIFGEYLVAGVCFLLFSMTLYAREVRTE